MNINTICITIILIMLFAPGSVIATNQPKVTGYQTGSTSVNKTYAYRTALLDEQLQPTKEQKPNIIKINYTVYLDYVFKWEMSLLMGEPIVVGWLSYKPTSIVPNSSALFSTFFTNKDELFNKIRVSEFKVKVGFYQHIKGERAFDHGAIHIFDCGVAWTPYLGHSDKELLNDGALFKKYRSYNVPGSPDWKDLYINIKNPHQAKNFFIDYSATARHITPHGKDVEIIKKDIDTSEIDKYLYDHLQRLEQNVVQGNTAGIMQEKVELESKIAREKQEITDRTVKQEADNKRSYIQKSFEEKIDYLLQNLENGEKETATLSQPKHEKERARISFLEEKINEATITLNKYRTENKNRITTHFFNKKSDIEKKMFAYYAKQTLKKIKTESSYDFYSADHQLIVSIPKQGIYAIHDFHEGMCGFCSSYQVCGYMDTTGAVVIKPEYKSISEFKNGVSLVQDNEHAYVINPSGLKIGKIKKVRTYGAQLYLNENHDSVISNYTEYDGHCDSRKSRLHSSYYTLVGELISSNITNWKNDSEFCLRWSR